ncbi:phage head closure protein [Kiloniella majae]|uniref:phage head closure protein n=1 Tax=Kiloniella majae TaxID=1938558 RepID=UPI000A277EB1|nr:phage head closure protein [Kiloniella majae]
MRIGKLRERISLQELSLAGDGGGGQVETWNEVAKVWANVKPLSGREQIIANKETGTTLYRITIRSRDISSSWRVVWGTKTLNIREILEGDSSQQFLTFNAELGVSA